MKRITNLENAEEAAPSQTATLESSLPDFWNVIFLQNQINDEMAEYVSKTLLSMDYINSKLASPEPITMIINSPGGSVTSAWQICDMMDYVSSEIHTVGVGNIYSSALLIFMNGAIGNRRVSDRCSIMSHRYSWASEGKHNDLIAVRKEQDFVYERMIRHYMECTGKSKTYIEKYLLQEHDAWLTPEEAKKHKVVDCIVPSKKSKLGNKSKGK